jgi:hypothetical protein
MMEERSQSKRSHEIVAPFPFLHFIFPIPVPASEIIEYGIEIVDRFRPESVLFW